MSRLHSHVAPGALTVLGIETSCDETAAAVVQRTGPACGTIVSNVVRSQTADHAAYGGVVPEVAARAHLDHLDRIIAFAMEQAGLAFADLDGIAATAGPGLINGLLVGLMTAKAIALAHDKPFVAVNHLEGHALTPGLTEGLEPPYLLLLVSGGHTQLLSVDDVGTYQRYGTTIDDALGEAFDKTAKLLTLGYPGGPAVEAAATAGDPDRFALPVPMKGRPGCDFSFSGLKTAVRSAATSIGRISAQDIADICASFQSTAAEAVNDRVQNAMVQFEEAHPGLEQRHLVVSGGVAANQALRTRLRETCKARGFRLAMPPAHLCTDNAAMIGWAGAERLVRGLADDLDFSARARWPLDPQATPAPYAGVKA